MAERIGARSTKKVRGFAHRGAPIARAQANTLPAFERALTLGAQGLEADIGLTRDGVPVLAHGGIPLPWGVRVGDYSHADLPAHIPTLSELYTRCGAGFDLSVDMGAPDAVDEVVRMAREHGAEERLWLTYWNVPKLAAWRRAYANVRLVFPTIPLSRNRTARLLSRLADAGVDVVNVHHRFCTGALVESARGAGLQVFAWGIKRRPALARVLALGIDGVYCDNVEEMVEMLRG